MNSPAPATAGADGDQDGDAVAAFMGMLRRVHELSGLTAGQIAVSSGLPRSTAYRFVDPKNNRLPKKREQLEAFLRACRLPNETVANMLALWDDISGKPIRSEGGGATLVEETTSTSWDRDLIPTPTRAVSEQIWRGYQQELPAATPAETLPDVSGVDLDLAILMTQYTREPTARHTSMCAHPGHCRNCLGIGRRAPSPQVPARRRARASIQGLVTRIFPVALLGIALYPMAMTIQFGHLFTNRATSIVAAVAILTGLLFGMSNWVRRPFWPQLLTPNRLVTAAITGVSFGLLAWMAVPVPLVGVLTGFSVYTITPLWIGSTKLTDITTSAHGLFTLITSAWCGIAIGYITSLAQFPLLGSVLAAVLGFAMAVMLLSSKAIDAPGPEMDTGS